MQMWRITSSVRSPAKLNTAVGRVFRHSKRAQCRQNSAGAFSLPRRCWFLAEKVPATSGRLSHPCAGSAPTFVGRSVLTPNDGLMASRRAKDSGKTNESKKRAAHARLVSQ
jgi:hypothetical protein